MIVVVAVVVVAVKIESDRHIHYDFYFSVTAYFLPSIHKLIANTKWVLVLFTVSSIFIISILRNNLFCYQQSEAKKY